MNIVIEKEEFDEFDHWLSMAKINFTNPQPDSRNFGMVVDDHGDVAYFNWRSPSAAIPRLNAEFDLRFFSEIGMFASYHWQGGGGHDGWWEIRRIDDGNLITTIRVVDHEETRGHALVLIPLEYTGGEIRFIVMGQDWLPAQTLKPEYTYPYTPEGSSATIASNTLVEDAYVQIVSLDNELIEEYRLSGLVDYQDLDWRQYTGTINKLLLIHPNSLSFARDVGGHVSGSENSNLLLIGSRSLSGGLLLDLTANQLLFKFPHDGEPNTGGGYIPFTFQGSGGHDLRFKASDIFSRYFEISVYNNGGYNDPFAGQPAEFELEIQDLPNGKKFLIGQIWDMKNEDYQSRELGSFRDPGNGMRVINWGRMDNEDSPYWKVQVVDGIDPRIWFWRLKFDEIGGETFNVNTYTTEEMSEFSAQRPEMWAEDGYLYADSDHTQYRWKNGIVTGENYIPLWSLSADSLGVAVPFGDDEGWITAERLQSDIVTPVVESTSSIKDGLNVYPNPAHETLTIATEFDSHFILYGSKGDAIKSGAILDGEATIIDISDLPGGIYYIRLSGQEKMMKFLKQ